MPLILTLESCSLMTMNGLPYSSNVKLISILNRFKLYQSIKYHSFYITLFIIYFHFHIKNANDFFVPKFCIFYYLLLLFITLDAS